MSAPLVSVIIPVFNRPALVANAIRSALGQQFTDLEVIVVDDGSDPPLVLPRGLREEARLRCLRLPRNGGAAQARNAGAREARGAWFAWLDSDDTWRPDKLRRQMARLETLTDRERVAVATGFAYVDATGGRDVRLPIPASDPALFFAGCWFAPGSSVILSRRLFERVGPFDERLRRLEDNDWFIRMALAGGRLEVVRENLVTVAKGRKAPYATVAAAGARMLRKFERQREALPPRALPILRGCLHYEYAAALMKRDHKTLRGLGHLALSWFHHPRLTIGPHDFWTTPGPA
ncbi:MAG TPA: glycosyltransferase family 2 protein [Thermopetrobacter sp.]|nr:glycosyltransferase family 2 protein [Thermopetrobacter sp.]